MPRDRVCAAAGRAEARDAPTSAPRIWRRWGLESCMGEILPRPGARVARRCGVLGSSLAWAPFRVQFYVNGHNWLALQLKRENIAYRLPDNALGGCADWQRAQQISDKLRVDQVTGQE